jgi:2-keto-4-pentenoate hydratase/2-oxohepta-3-ene-1,7-dioic acid hydratase in catechol pathway
VKLFTYVYKGQEQVGVMTVDEKNIIPLAEKDMQTLIENWSEQKQKEIQTLLKTEKGIDLEQIQLKAPIPRPKQDVICLGINYMAHAEESARYKEEAFGGERPKAIYFSKRVNEAVADKEPIQGHFDIVESLDYEVELAVVIGKDAKNVAEKDVFDYVFGYTILNDVSARNLQTSHKQWYFGKSLDGFTPIGPCIVTKEEFQNPPALAIKSYINGELRQNSTTDLLIFGIAHVVSELSQGMTLQAGTMIAMGTPAGVGMGFVPPNFLKAGDEVKCEIEGIGTLTNVVK